MTFNYYGTFVEAKTTELGLIAFDTTTFLGDGSCKLFPVEDEDGDFKGVAIASIPSGINSEQFTYEMAESSNINRILFDNKDSLQNFIDLLQVIKETEL